MIHALALILACQLAGEMLSRLMFLPAPGPVVGMVLLVGLFAASPRIAALVRPVGETIIRHLSLLFVPAGVGVIGHLGLISQNALALAVVLLVSAVLALAAGALTFVAVARLTRSTGGKDA